MELTQLHTLKEEQGVERKMGHIDPIKGHNGDWEVI